MTVVAIVALALVASAEFLIGGLMFVVWQDIKYDMESVKRNQEKCFVCVTGASVTSFRHNYNMCHKHLAHWVLIHDLEKKTKEELG